jgi:hypothetical protein
VALKTVYVAFGSKSGLLRALWHLRLRGDQAEAPVGERPWYRAVLDEPNPRRALELNIGNAKAVRARIGPLLEVIQDGAVADTEVAELWGRIEREFYENQRAVVESLHRKRALKPGLSVARAADILWTLNNPAVYRLLVRDRGWTAGQHEKWLTEALSEQLLARRG